MKKILSLIFITYMTSLCASNIGIVNTNVLLIKSNPSNESAKLGYFKNGETINILSNNVKGLDSDELWLETVGGYVKSAYVIEESKLPPLITYDQLDGTKPAIQLAVTQKNYKSILYKYRQKLINENNVYVETTKRANVLYLVNFDSYSDAKKVLQRIKNIFPDAYLTSFKPKKVQFRNSKKIKPIKAKPIKKIKVKNIKKNDKMSDEVNMDEINSIIESLDDVEDVTFDSKVLPKEPIKKVVVPKVAQKKEKVKKIVKPKVVTPKVETKIVQKKEVKKEKESFESMLEKMIINLDK